MDSWLAARLSPLWLQKGLTWSQQEPGQRGRERRGWDVTVRGGVGKQLWELRWAPPSCTRKSSRTPQSPGQGDARCSIFTPSAGSTDTCRAPPQSHSMHWELNMPQMRAVRQEAAHPSPRQDPHTDRVGNQPQRVSSLVTRPCEAAPSAASTSSCRPSLGDRVGALRVPGKRFSLCSARLQAPSWRGTWGGRLGQGCRERHLRRTK